MFARSCDGHRKKASRFTPPSKSIALPSGNGSGSNTTRFTSAQGPKSTEARSAAVISSLRHPFFSSSSPKSNKNA